MDDLNLTMEEYIRFKEEKAHKRGKVFNWQTATYGKIRVDDDLHNLSSMEAEFPAIVINDAVAPQDELQCKSQNEFPAIVYNDAQTEPILNPQHIDEFVLNDKTSLSEYDEEEQNVLYFNDLFPFNIIRPDNLKFEKYNDDSKIDIILMLFFLIKNLCAPFGVPFYPKRYYKDGVCAILLRRPRSIRHMALPLREQRHRFLRYEGMEYLDTDIFDFEGILAMIHKREVHRVSVFDFRGLPDLMAKGLSGRMLMEHRDEVGVSVFTSRAKRMMLDIRGPLVHELILEFFSTFRFGLAILDLDTLGTLQFQLGRARRRRESQTDLRQGDLRDYWIRISSAGDFLGTAPSYIVIKDPILRLCHRLIACSIAGRSRAPEKVTLADLFYLRGMHIGSVNVPYLLARYLRLFTTGRKSGAHIFGGQFVARLAEHFGLMNADILGRLTVIVPELPVIDMTELVRLQICVELDDTWAWVAMGPERQPDTKASAPVDAKDAPIVDEGDQAISTPVQALQQPPLPPLAAARTIPQRLGRLEEDVHGAE
ncbi:hypothetical protein Tco_0988711 [Tanacetum coccineum]|uniref:Uncharacterized protein n=1 Tax=Tanacetum coccineum TaxID=301880 RepID=A0ABQ5ERX2_9ASTR